MAALSLIGGHIVDYRIDCHERARFKRCRRQWDFASPHRQDLEPTDAVVASLPAALKDALAVYYYPGTWDWPHEMTQSLVHKAFERAIDDAGASDQRHFGAALLDCYDAWARTVDDFAPVRIGYDVQALVPDPREPERGLLTPDGRAVKYTERIDLVAVDSVDEYWVVRHLIVDDWQDLDTLFRDEDAVAACWAWEQDYMGMEIAGTIHNEVLVAGPLRFPDSGRDVRGTPRTVAQTEASGGGRSVPQHIRVDARDSRPNSDSRTEQCVAGLVRRTRIRRSRDEISAVGKLIAAEAVDMINAPAVYPAPAAHCLTCEFNAPCLLVMQGSDPAPMLAAHFRKHPVEAQTKPRLGQSTWGFGRGAAPPRW